MAKGKTFADKIAKKDRTIHCPKCGEVLKEIKLVRSVFSEKTNSWKFNTKLVDMCNCNKKDIIK